MTYTDAAGQTTAYAYNSKGQLTQTTDPLGNITTYEYDGLGYLISILNANGATEASFTYDAYGRVASSTDWEGHTITYTYDPMDRVTAKTYPDGTTRAFTWDKLDLVAVTDRQGRTTSYSYDAVRRLIAVTDSGNTTQLGYFENQNLKSLSDPNGNTTTWDIDVQGRVTAKHYTDGTVVGNKYEFTTSRLRSITDALGQIKQYAYARDDRVTGIDYLNAVNATPNVRFGYDTFLPRITSVTDDLYDTVHIPTRRLARRSSACPEIGPFQNATIGYQYDPLGRVTRTVANNVETFSYDAIGRLASDV